MDKPMKRRIKPEQVDRIKTMLTTRSLSLRQVASRVGVSYYIVWLVKTGHYETGRPLLEAFKAKEPTFFKW